MPANSRQILLICSWLCVSWFTVLAILGAELYHTSRHVWDIPITTFPPMARVTWLAELSFLLTGCCVKVSVLLFYRRLTESTCSRFWIWAVWAAIGLTVSYTLAFILVLVFNCTPTEAYWKAFDLTYAATVDYHCVDTTVINLLAGIMAAVSDLYAVALPCIMMRNLRIPFHQKIALNIVFSLGLLVVGASGVRTYWLWRKTRASTLMTMLISPPRMRPLCRCQLRNLQCLRVVPARTDPRHHVCLSTFPPSPLPRVPQRHTITHQAVRHLGS